MKRTTLVFIVLLIICSCKKNETTTNSSSSDELTDVQIQIIEAAGIDTSSTYKVALFPNGINMSEWEKKNDSGYIYIFSRRANSASDNKLLFINAMTHAGFLLTTRSNYTFPSQVGLAYVYNSKSIQTASTYPGATCQQPLYGVDCSGMIYQMANASGLNLPKGGTTDYVKTDLWNSAFKNSPDFQKLEMRDSGALSPSKIESGDIIVAPGNHIGMVFNNGSSIGVFNSLGRTKYPCSKNSDIYHGPVISKDLSKWLQTTFGTAYHVLRVIQKGDPGLTTAPISSITSTSAISGGNITNNGGDSITARGVCWSTSQNSTIANSKTSDGSGSGSFTSNITGLTANTTYYLRAYATNTAGTAYGNEVSFKTLNASQDTCWFTWDYSAEVLDQAVTTQYLRGYNPGVDLIDTRTLMTTVTQSMNEFTCFQQGNCFNGQYVPCPTQFGRQTGYELCFRKGTTVTLRVDLTYAQCTGKQPKSIYKTFVCN
ncbi:MAG: hypothetical protein EOP48_18425 [Sphingobacteriales bacterium]|nr:MAG: hypothetical protein EOP48_18425 [Sphingobacteriales bacterium]